MKDKVYIQIKKHYYGLLSMLLAMLCMFITCQISGIGFGGQYSIVRGDQMYNYIPAIRNLCRAIMNGDNIFYTWSMGMGINASLLNAYYCYSPFNIVYYLFYAADMNVVTLVLIIFKTGLAALSFQIFISKSYDVDGMVSTIFSILYSMCAYQVAFNIHNIIWQDAMFVLPLVLLGVDNLVVHGKYKGLIFWYAFIFISQFYMGYMIGIAGTIYLAFSIYIRVDKTRRSILITLCKYGGCVVEAVCISAWAWLPALLFLISNVQVNIGGVAELDANMIDVFNQFFWGEVSNFDAIFPYVYCGCIMLVVVPLFFLDKNIKRALKIGMLIILFLLFASCVFMPIYALWHGFDEPNSYAYRFSYIISMFMCIIGAIEFERIDRKCIKKLTLILIADVFLYLIAMIWQDRRISSGYTSNTMVLFATNMLMISCWMAGIIAFNELDGKKKKGLMVLLIVAVIVEVTTNGYELLRGKGRLGSEFPNDEYQVWGSFEAWATDMLATDGELYRVSSPQDFNPSSGLFWGYNSMSYFGSAENVRLRNALNKLGMWTSERMVLCHGLTPITKLLFGVKYDLMNYVTGEDGGIGAKIIYNDVNLSIGYVVGDDILDLNLDGNDVFENNNKLATAVMGDEIVVFEKVDESKIYFVENGISISADNGRMLIQKEEDTENPYLEIKVVDDVHDDKAYFLCLENDDTEYDSHSFYLQDDEEYTNTNGALFVPFIKQMTKNDYGYTVRIIEGNKSNRQYIDGVNIYSLESNLLQEIYERLYDNQLWVDAYHNGYIHGYTDTDESGILLITVPYEKGWKAKVDNASKDVIPVIDDSFIAIDIGEEGLHEVTLQFETPGATVGKILSFFGLTLFLCLGLKEKLYDQKANAVN